MQNELCRDIVVKTEIIQNIGLYIIKILKKNVDNACAGN